MKKAIIGGTGVYHLAGDSLSKEMHTPFGSVTVEIVGEDQQEVVFLARHGKEHQLPPHRINYRANLFALKELGVSYICGTAAVGSCNTNYAPGDLVMITDFLDFTRGRPVTLFDGDNQPVRHVDMTEPYCRELRRLTAETARKEGIPIEGEAVYVCTEGPRFETAAEIRMFQQLGGDVVGMTNVPEVVFARELGMCYVVIGMVTNWCTGMQQDPIGLHDIQEALGNNKKRLTRLFLSVFQQKLTQEQCTCERSVIEL